ARDIVAGHHERFDGSGYPCGLAGESIPLCARIVAVADVYDACSSDRVYRAAMPHEEVVQIIKEGSGSHFDPTIVTAFLEVADEFRRICEELADRVATTAVSATPREAAPAAAALSSCGL